MPKGIEEFVSENREEVRKIDATFVPVSNQSTKTFSFTNSEIEVNVSIKVYTRSLNNTLISGHPNGSNHGSGHGVSGDQRGSWSLETDVEESKDFVQSGRNNVRDTLAGETTGSIQETAVGSDSSTANPDNTTLGSENGRVFAWGKAGGSSDESIGESVFLFHEFGDSVTEYGVYSEDGSLYNRITTSTINPTKEEELRTETTFNITGDGIGNTAFTNDGEEVVARSIRSTDAAIGLDEIVFGDGTSSPDKTDTSLGNQTFSKVAQRQTDPETVTAHTVVFQNEPSGVQPTDVKEMGVVDNNGNLIWRAVVDTFTKDSNTEFEVFAGFRAK